MGLQVREILQYTSDAILSLDHDLNIVLFNPAAERLFGYSKEDILGQPLDMLLPEHLKAEHQKHIENFRNSSDTARKMSARNLVMGATKCGDEKFLNISIQKHPAGSDFEFTAICRDVTDEVTTTNALVENEARFSRAQAIAHIGSWEWDIPTGNLAWSDETYRIFEKAEQEFDPTYEKFLETIHPDDRERVSVAVADSVDNGAPYSSVHRIVCSNGREKIVHEIGQTLSDPSGKTNGMEGTVQDITASWKMNEELIKATRTASDAQQTKSQFVAMISHELRTPMNAILGFSSLIDHLAQADGDNKYNEYARNIMESGQHLLSLIDDVLQFSEFGENPPISEPEYIGTSLLIAEAQKMVQFEADKKNIKIRSYIERDLPELYLDPIQSRHILRNLLSNAVKFSDESSTVIVSIEKYGHEIVLAVKDYGIGMSEEEVRSIFDPFAQADMELTRSYQGMGLGLAIVRTLAESHGGRIEVESKLGTGSTFKVVFPVPDEATAAPAKITATG